MQADLLLLKCPLHSERVTLPRDDARTSSLTGPHLSNRNGSLRTIPRRPLGQGSELQGQRSFIDDRITPFVE
jgi:hypothetical protein